MNINKIKTVIIAALIALAGFLGYNGLQEPQQEPQSVGSIITGQEYEATTTGVSSGNTVALRQLKSSPGALGQVTITAAAAGEMYFYNATTTNNSLRVSQATTSITLVHFPGNAAAGTYVFDATFDKGIFLLLVGTPQPTTTITYR